MILQRIRIIVGDAGFENGTSAPEVYIYNKLHGGEFAFWERGAAVRVLRKFKEFREVRRKKYEMGRGGEKGERGR